MTEVTQNSKPIFGDFPVICMRRERIFVVVIFAKHSDRSQVLLNLD